MREEKRCRRSRLVSILKSRVRDPWAGFLVIVRKTACRNLCSVKFYFSDNCPLRYISVIVHFNPKVQTLPSLYSKVYGPQCNLCLQATSRKAQHLNKLEPSSDSDTAAAYKAHTPPPAAVAYTLMAPYLHLVPHSHYGASPPPRYTCSL